MCGTLQDGLEQHHRVMHADINQQVFKTHTFVRKTPPQRCFAHPEYAPGFVNRPMQGRRFANQCS